MSEGLEDANPASESLVPSCTTYEVVFTAVKVRVAPSLGAPVLSVREAGQRVRTDAEFGGWVRLEHKFGSFGSRGWMLVHGAALGLGLLLRKLEPVKEGASEEVMRAVGREEQAAEEDEMLAAAIAASRVTAEEEQRVRDTRPGADGDGSESGGGGGVGGDGGDGGGVGDKGEEEEGEEDETTQLIAALQLSMGQRSPTDSVPAQQPMPPSLQLLPSPMAALLSELGYSPPGDHNPSLLSSLEPNFNSNFNSTFNPNFNPFFEHPAGEWRERLHCVSAEAMDLFDLADGDKVTLPQSALSGLLAAFPQVPPHHGMPYHTALPCHTTAYHTIPHCPAMPHHGIPYQTALPCHTMPYHAIPCHTMPYHAKSCQRMPCHAMPAMQ